MHLFDLVYFDVNCSIILGTVYDYDREIKTKYNAPLSAYFLTLIILDAKPKKKCQGQQISIVQNLQAK